jgi:hypothetical protein
LAGTTNGDDAASALIDDMDMYAVDRSLSRMLDRVLMNRVQLDGECVWVRARTHTGMDQLWNAILQGNGGVAVDAIEVITRLYSSPNPNALAVERAMRMSDIHAHVFTEVDQRLRSFYDLAMRTMDSSTPTAMASGGRDSSTAANDLAHYVAKMCRLLRTLQAYVSAFDHSFDMSPNVRVYTPLMLAYIGATFELTAVCKRDVNNVFRSTGGGYSSTGIYSKFCWVWT